MESRSASLSLHRYGTPAEAGAAVVFLLANGWMNGITLKVDRRRVKEHCLGELVRARLLAKIPSCGRSLRAGLVSHIMSPADLPWFLDDGLSHRSPVVGLDGLSGGLEAFFSVVAALGRLDQPPGMVFIVVLHLPTD